MPDQHIHFFAVDPATGLHPCECGLKLEKLIKDEHPEFSTVEECRT